MNLRFYNARLLKMESDAEVSEGELWVRGNRIAYAGPSDEKKLIEAGQMNWDREEDVQGNLLMPGFKNAHTHSGMTFLRSYADDLPLEEWLNKQVFPMEAKLTPDDIYYLSKLAILEYLTSGITANFDMYISPGSIAQASIDCGFRTVLTSGFNDFGPSLKEVERAYVELNKKHELISFMMGFHAEYTTSEENLKGILRLAEKYKAPVFTHNSETAPEVRGCRERHGMTPTMYLDSLGLFEYGGGGFHCVHMSEEDLELFQKKGLYAVTNPASNVKLASGIAPIQKMLDMGIRVAIGTDGPASNNCLDMFREMFLTTGLAKLRENDASAVEAQQVVRMACTEGARAMGLADCDSLSEGKLADFILIDLKQPNMQPLNHITKNLVYAGSKQNVKMTVVNGKILYEEGRFYVGEAAEDIYKAANRIIKEKKAE